MVLHLPLTSCCSRNRCAQVPVPATSRSSTPCSSSSACRSVRASSGWSSSTSSCSRCSSRSCLSSPAPHPAAPSCHRSLRLGNRRSTRTSTPGKDGVLCMAEPALGCPWHVLVHPTRTNIPSALQLALLRAPCLSADGWQPEANLEPAASPRVSPRGGGIALNGLIILVEKEAGHASDASLVVPYCCHI